MESGADLREMGKFIQPQLLNLFTTFHSILQFILMFSDTKFMAAFFFFLGILQIVKKVVLIEFLHTYIKSLESKVFILRIIIIIIKIEMKK